MKKIKLTMVGVLSAAAILLSQPFDGMAQTVKVEEGKKSETTSNNERKAAAEFEATKLEKELEYKRMNLQAGIEAGKFSEQEIKSKKAEITDLEKQLEFAKNGGGVSSGSNAAAPAVEVHTKTSPAPVASPVAEPVKKESKQLRDLRAAQNTIVERLNSGNVSDAERAELKAKLRENDMQIQALEAAEINE